jgi:hypothetical protein
MKRLDIIRTNYELAINYRWRSPAAYFLIFFCLFWDGFLVFWYGIGLATGEMPTMFFLFPLIHVAVGIGLTYYTVCLFVNTTQIRADQRTLKVNHGPLPWPRGNKEIAVRDVQQLYVKENVGSKGQRSYVLKALLNSGDDITLLPSVNASAEALLQLERSVEDYLGIPDQPTAGEMAGRVKPTMELEAGRPPRRPSRTSGYVGVVGIEQAEVGDFITYESRTFEVSHVSTHQWNDGNTDRQLQLAAVDGQHALVYVLQNKGLYTIFLEIEFTRAQQLALNFEDIPTPSSITYQDVAYELFSQQVGEQFRADRSESVSATQWIYRSAEGDEQLRILDHQGMQAVYFGQEEIAPAFGVLTP